MFSFDYQNTTLLQSGARYYNTIIYVVSLEDIYKYT